MHVICTGNCCFAAPANCSANLVWIYTSYKLCTQNKQLFCSPNLAIIFRSNCSAKHLSFAVQTSCEFILRINCACNLHRQLPANPGPIAGCFAASQHLFWPSIGHHFQVICTANCSANLVWIYTSYKLCM